MAPSHIPAGWRLASYGDVLSETDERAGGKVDLPVLSVTKTRGLMLASERFGKVMHGRDLARYRIARRDQVIADPMLLWDGSIGLQNVVEAGLVSPDYRVYQPKVGVDQQFLGMYVRSPGQVLHYQAGAKGTNVRRNRISRSDFLSVPLLLPPLNEQKKIAAILASMNDACEATQAIIDQTQKAKRIMMVDVFSRGMTGRHARFTVTELGNLPTSWSVLDLAALLEDIQSGWSPQCEPRPAMPDEWGVLKISAVSWGQFREQENKKLPAAMSPKPELEVKQGDVLLSRANTTELVGRSVLVGELRSKLMLCDKILRLRPRRQLITPEFLNLVLSAPSARRQIEEAATGTSDSMRNVSQEKLRATLIPVPPLAEQLEIFGLFDAITARGIAEEAKLSGLSALKGALMSALLDGKVRVQCDEAST